MLESHEVEKARMGRGRRHLDTVFHECVQCCKLQNGCKKDAEDDGRGARDEGSDTLHKRDCPPQRARAQVLAKCVRSFLRRTLIALQKREQVRNSACDDESNEQCANSNNKDHCAHPHALSLLPGRAVFASAQRHIVVPGPQRNNEELERDRDICHEDEKVVHPVRHDSHRHDPHVSALGKTNSAESTEAGMYDYEDKIILHCQDICWRLIESCPRPWAVQDRSTNFQCSTFNGAEGVCLKLRSPRTQVEVNLLNYWRGVQGQCSTGQA